MGAVPESQTHEFTNKIAGKYGDQPQVAGAIAAAAEARDAEDLQTAAQIYDAALEQAPNNADAIAELADVLYEAGDTAWENEVLRTFLKTKSDPCSRIGSC